MLFKESSIMAATVRNCVLIYYLIQIICCLDIRVSRSKDGDVIDGFDGQCPTGSRKTDGGEANRCTCNGNATTFHVFSNNTFGCYKRHEIEPSCEVTTTEAGDNVLQLRITNTGKVFTKLTYDVSHKPDVCPSTLIRKEIWINRTWEENNDDSVEFSSLLTNEFSIHIQNNPISRIFGRLWRVIYLCHNRKTGCLLMKLPNEVRMTIDVETSASMTTTTTSTASTTTETPLTTKKATLSKKKTTTSTTIPTSTTATSTTTTPTPTTTTIERLSTTRKTTPSEKKTTTSTTIITSTSVTSTTTTPTPTTTTTEAPSTKRKTTPSKRKTTTTPIETPMMPTTKRSSMKPTTTQINMTVKNPDKRTSSSSSTLMTAVGVATAFVVILVVILLIVTIRRIRKRSEGEHEGSTIASTASSTEEYDYARNEDFSRVPVVFPRRQSGMRAPLPPIGTAPTNQYTSLTFVNRPIESYDTLQKKHKNNGGTDNGTNDPIYVVTEPEPIYFDADSTYDEVATSNHVTGNKQTDDEPVYFETMPDIYAQVNKTTT